MTDKLLALANHPWTAPLVRTLGLPQPRRLRRRGDAFAQRELAGLAVGIVGVPAGGDAAILQDVLAALGAEPAVAPASLAALVVDARGCDGPAALAFLHSGVPGALAQLAPSGRALVLAPGAAIAPGAAAAARALEGFTRSLARELGRRGATANCLHVPPGAEASLPAALAFFCSDRSAYVSGQVLQLAAAGAAAANLLPLLQGRTAVVTGAAGGIGAATVRRLAAEGAHVVCADIPQAHGALQALAAEVGGSALTVDITAAEAPQALVAALAARGGADVVVHNAGITRDRTLARMSRAEWDAVLAVNLEAVLAIDRALDAAACWRPGAREICLSSISGIAGNAGQANYATAKAALIGYVAARAQQLPARGMSINAIAPGFIETAMTRAIPFMVREAGRRLNALAQGGQPEDVAEAIAFLVRPDAGGVNGQTLRVCGQSFLGA